MCPQDALFSRNGFEVMFNGLFYFKQVQSCHKWKWKITRVQAWGEKTHTDFNSNAWNNIFHGQFQKKRLEIQPSDLLLGCGSAAILLKGQKQLLLSQLRLSPNFPNDSFLELFPEVHVLRGRMSPISEFTIKSLKLCNLLVLVLLSLKLRKSQPKVVCIFFQQKQSFAPLDQSPVMKEKCP